MPEDFWNLKSDREKELEDENFVREKTLDEFIMSMPSPFLEVISMVDAGFGDYMTLAYELSWEEGQDILELIEIREEMKRREKIKQAAQTAGT